MHANVQNVFIRRSHDRDVQLRKTNEIQAHQIERIRFFYIQILIIAFREDRHFNSCVRCVREWNFFAKCYNLNALKKETCVNCVWKNDSAQCQHRTKFQFFLIYRKLMILNAMYAILRFALFFSAQQFVTMTIFLRSTAHASKSRTIETIVKTSSQNAFQRSIYTKANDDAIRFERFNKKNCEVCFSRTKHLNDIILTKISSDKKKKRKRKKKKI